MNEGQVSSQYHYFLRKQAEDARKQKQQSRLHELYQNRQYHQDEAKNFPFGKERDRIARHVIQQMSCDEENKQRLEKFRIDAIRHRNQKIMRHIGAQPYLTESMLPGISVDPSKYVEKPEQIYTAIKPMPETMIPQYQPRRKSIGTSTPEVYSSPKPKKKKKYIKKVITDSQEDQTFEKIKKMLGRISSQIQQNSQTLHNNIRKSAFPLREDKKQTIKYRENNPRYFTESLQQTNFSPPTIQYNISKKNPSFQSQKASLSQTRRVRTIKDHLQLLKKKRKRLEQLDQYMSP